VKKTFSSLLRWTFALVLLFGPVMAIAASEVEPPRLDWDDVCPIAWSLFQGTPPSDAVHRTEAAAIHMTIRWNASYSISSSTGTNWVGHVASVTVTNTMEPTLSWVVPGKAQASILQHEQLHFDLNEAYRRKLECMLLAIASCSATTQQGAVDQLNAALHQTADAVLQTLFDMQALYDSETAHSTDAKAQARWQGLVASWLAAPMTAP
jgi:hypothetical protein